jgi:hypothetical protein
VRKTAEDKSMQAERPGKVRRSVLLPAGIPQFESRNAISWQRSLRRAKSIRRLGW